MFVKLRMLATIATLLLLLAACGGGDTGTGDTSSPTGGTDGNNTEAADGGGGDEGPVRIAAILDVTGAGATLAEQQVKALEMLAAELNDAGGINGREVELEIIDNRSEEAAAAQATTEAINEGVHVIIGASRTGPSMAMRQIALDNEVPMIALAAGDAIVRDAPWVFKTTKNAGTIVDKLVEDWSAQGYQTVGMLRDASAFGEGVDTAVQEAGDIEIAFDDRFEPDATDFDPLIVRLRDAGADVNLVWAIGSPPFLATNAYRDLGVDAPLYLPTTNPTFLNETGDNGNGVRFPGEKMFVWDELPEDDPQYDTIQDFVDRYQAEHGEVPDHFAGAAHDAFMQAVEAIEQNGTDPEAIRDHLESLSGWVGVNGVYDRSADDHTGLGTDDLVIVEVVEGETPFDRWSLVEADG